MERGSCTVQNTMAGGLVRPAEKRIDAASLRLGRSAGPIVPGRSTQGDKINRPQPEGVTMRDEVWVMPTSEVHELLALDLEDGWVE